MRRILKTVAPWLLALACWIPGAEAASSDPAPPPIPEELVPFTPPPAEGPVMVRPYFDLHDINQISDKEETFTFTGVLTLVWRDPRLAFTPTDGVDELVYQGNYQFNEVATGWYTTVVLANASGQFDVTGVVLRIITPDGTCTLTQAIDATAEVDLNMRLYPFDQHRIQAVFELLGFDLDDLIDRRCRWLFPLFYFGANVLMIAVAEIIY